MLLEQTKDTGVDVYTHSEMLPAHYYPAFKKYPHFVGNYGNAWWKQKEEFERFHGPILMTTNCIVPPKTVIKTGCTPTGAAGIPPAASTFRERPGKRKIFPRSSGRQNTALPQRNWKPERSPEASPHGQVLALADKVVDAVKIREPSENLWSWPAATAGQNPEAITRNFAKALPEDTVDPYRRLRQIQI